MSASTMTFTYRPEPLTAAEQDRRGGELIAAMVALPPGHPLRAVRRAEAIEAWLPMAQRLARRYTGRGESPEDLSQTAMVGLIKAVDRFDAGHGVDFVAYAIPTILGEIKRYFRDRAWVIRVPRRLQEMRMAINDANGVLAHRLGRAPTIADIAAYLNVTEESVLEGLEGALAYRASSLSAPVGVDGTAELGDSLGSDERDYALTELRIVLEPVLAGLDDRERRIVTMRFYGNQTQSQIAEQVGVSQMHVSRLLTAALAKMRARLGADAR
jgi:RNA polymerase sigma-B factor